MACEAFNHSMDWYMSHPEELRGWYSNRFTTREYPSRIFKYLSTNKLGTGKRVRVKFWKHPVSGKVLQTEVLRSES